MRALRLAQHGRLARRPGPPLAWRLGARACGSEVGKEGGRRAAGPERPRERWGPVEGTSLMAVPADEEAHSDDDHYGDGDAVIPGMGEDDPFNPGPSVPQHCEGCGAKFQSRDANFPGYVPRGAQEYFSVGNVKKVIKKPHGVPVDSVPEGVPVQALKDFAAFKPRSVRMICRRCYRLQHYHKLDHKVEQKFYKLEEGQLYTEPDQVVSKVAQRIRKESLVLMVVDVLDFESSVVPELFMACRQKLLQVIFLINKIDLLPQGVQMERIKLWSRRMSRHMKNVQLQDVCLISSQTGEGFHKLEERMSHFMDAREPKWIYVLGRVNSGKSTFVNKFLHHIGFKNGGHVNHRTKVGGVTRSPIPGTTLNFVSFPLPKQFRLIDTPGIPSKTQITALLKRDEDLFDVLPQKRIQPLTHAMKEGGSMLLGAMARFDLVHGDWCYATVHMSHRVTVHIIKTVKAKDFMERKACTFLYPPHHPEDFDAMPPLVRHRVEVFGSHNRSWDDIVISGLGWVSLTGVGTKVFDVWVPKGVKVFRRPAIMPYEVMSKGVKPFHFRARARSQKVHKKKRKMVDEMRDKEKRNILRAELAQAEEDRLNAPSEEGPLVNEAEVAEEFDVFEVDDE
mmetsp:Transcript_114136/g.261955  ORF Transcript_114136/g.261955 Transcript_114136/m.261955 type:complete len:620 (+) Transcript_114136:15-1874(+)